MTNIIYNDKKYYDLLSVPPFTYTRNGEHMGKDQFGQWRLFGANAVPYLDNIGLDMWGQSVNKCTNINTLFTGLVTPTSAATFNSTVSGYVAAGGDANTLFGIVDDTSNIVLSGFSRLIDEGKLNGRVLVVDNTLGATTANIGFSGQTGNTNTHVFSAFVRGTGIAQPRLIQVVGTSNNLTNLYTRVSSGPMTPTSTTNNAAIYVPVGSIVYIFLHQLEERTYASPPIPNYGTSTVSRVASNAKFEHTPGTSGYILARCRRPDTTGVTRRIIGTNSATGNQTPLVWQVGNTGVGTWNGTNGVTANINPSIGSFVTSVVTWGPGRRQVCANGVLSASDANTIGSWTQLHLGNGGSFGSGECIDGPIDKIQIGTRELTTAEMIAMTTITDYYSLDFA